MKIQDLQSTIAAELNGYEELVKGGCKAFAEDSRSIYDEAVQWTQKGKIALVVVTPDMQRNGDAANGIPAETELQIQCSEKPAVSRVKSGTITALDAAELVMHALDGGQFCWISTRQSFDLKTATLTATVTFETSIILSR